MSLILPRRRFLGALAAPIIVQAANIMPVKLLLPEPFPGGFWHIVAVTQDGINIALAADAPPITWAYLGYASQGAFQVGDYLHLGS